MMMMMILSLLALKYGLVEPFARAGRKKIYIFIYIYIYILIQFNSIYFKDSLCHSNQACKVKTKNNITEHKRK